MLIMTSHQVTCFGVTCEYDIPKESEFKINFSDSASCFYIYKPPNKVKNLCDIFTDAP